MKKQRWRKRCPWWTGRDPSALPVSPCQGCCGQWSRACTSQATHRRCEPTDYAAAGAYQSTSRLLLKDPEFRISLQIQPRTAMEGACRYPDSDVGFDYGRRMRRILGSIVAWFPGRCSPGFLHQRELPALVLNARLAAPTSDRPTAFR